MSSRTQGRVAETGPRSYEGWIGTSDIFTAAKLACCSVAALLPQRAWPALARALARLHRALKGSRSDAIAAACREFLGVDPRAVEFGAICAEYEEGMEMIRELLPGGWRPAIVLRGSDAIDAALTRGRGAVLWVSGFAHSDVVTKKALALAGHVPTHLSHFGHPFSATRFGAALLNPLRLRAENRYVSRRVLVSYGNAKPALELLAQALRNNEVVTITAIGAGRQCGETDFLGGTLRLALGAPRLARETGAALIPVFTVRDENGGYAVHCGPDLTPAQGGALDLSTVVARFGALLEPHVRVHPTEWQGWFSRTWQPGARISRG